MPNTDVIIYFSLAAQLTSRLSLKVPYTMKEYQVGFEKNVAIELPIRVLAQKSQQGAYEFAFTPTHLENNGKPQGEIQLYSYESVPYTAVVQQPFAKTLAQKYQEFNRVKTQQQGQAQKFTVGQQYGIKAVIESQSDRSKYPQWNKFTSSKTKVLLKVEEQAINTVIVSIGQDKQFTLKQSRQQQQQQSQSQSGSDSNSQENTVNTSGSSSSEENDRKSSNSFDKIVKIKLVPSTLNMSL
jgi:hypothetical protein